MGRKIYRLSAPGFTRMSLHPLPPPHSPLPHHNAKPPQETHSERRSYYVGWPVLPQCLQDWFFLILIVHFFCLGKVGLPSRRKAVVEKYPAVLECLTDANLPSENVLYTWTKDGSDATTDERATVIASGALFIKSTRRSNTGVYQCTAKTVDSSGLVTYAGAKTLLDVQCKLEPVCYCK